MFLVVFGSFGSCDMRWLEDIVEFEDCVEVFDVEVIGLCEENVIVWVCN